MASLRPLVRPSSFALHSRQLQQRLFPAVRSASTAHPKPRLLEKPERFNPPSHGKRTPVRKTYGAPLSAAARQEQAQRVYPHMFPAEGTFMFWFLTHRTIHSFISVGVLILLCVAIWVQDFLTTTPYKDLLPPNSMFLEHPWSWVRQCWDVYDMHVAWRTKEVQEKRKRKTEDVRKRAEFRKAHGMEMEDAALLGGWTWKSDSELMGPAVKSGDDDSSSPVAKDEAADPEPSKPTPEERRRHRKVIFGIW